MTDYLDGREQNQAKWVLEKLVVDSITEAERRYA